MGRPVSTGAPQPPATVRAHVLLVEDDPALGEVLRDFLTTLRYRTTVVTNGREAVAAARTLQPDIIILDLMLPGLTGGEVAARLKAALPTARIPIVATSALPDVRLLGELLPIDAVLPKPFDLEMLERALSRLLEPPDDQSSSQPVSTAT